MTKSFVIDLHCIVSGACERGTQVRTRDGGGVGGRTSSRKARANDSRIAKGSKVNSIFPEIIFSQELSIDFRDTIHSSWSHDTINWSLITW
jgi:hypothetical protein